MRRQVLRALAVVGISAGFAGCATTSFTSTWKDPEAGPVEMGERKVVAVVMSDSSATKRSAEDAVARELTKLGVQAVPSFQLLAPEATKEEAKAKLEADGYEVALVMRVTDKSQEVYSTPGVYAPYARRSYYGLGRVGVVYGSAPEIRTNTLVYVETLVYSLKEDRLVWAGVSETTNPSKLDAFAAELTKVAIGEMKKSGLVR